MRNTNFYLSGFILFISLLIYSCGGAKYNYHFDQGKHIDFNSGKWLLNNPKTNFTRNVELLEFAKNKFSEIIPDSLLLLLVDVRRNKVIGPEIPHNPSLKDLQRLKLLTECDYLINIKTEIVKNDLGSFTFSRSQGRAKKINKAITEITIYDLNKIEVLSKSSSVGKVEVIETEDSGWDYVSSGWTLAVQSLKNLVRKYKKYKIYN